MSPGALQGSIEVPALEPSGPIIFHLFGPSACKGSGRDLPFPSPFRAVRAFSLPVSLLFTYGALIGFEFPWLVIPPWGPGVHSTESRVSVGS